MVKENLHRAKIIVNEIDHTGILELGHQIKVGYYAEPARIFR